MSAKKEQSKADPVDQVAGGAKPAEQQAAPADGGDTGGEELAKLHSRNERLETELEAANEAVKAAGTAARESLFAFIGEELVKRKVVTAKEAAAEGFGPVAAVFAELDTVTAERNALKRQLTAQKGATTKVRGAMETLEESLKPRALGPLEDQLTAPELAELFAGTPRVELAYSDGKAELAGVPPVAVPGSAFTFRRGRMMLDTGDLLVRGPIDQLGARVLAGYALLIDGEQVAWVPRLAGQLTLGPGQSYSIKDDVVLA